METSGAAPGISEAVMELFARRGENAYYGEDVSQQEHALQTAYLGEKEGASDSLVVSALLHDIGHLLLDLPEDIADLGVDAGHEHGGGEWLMQNFSPEIAEPARLHVAAKRYLCATDSDYLGRLSPASVQSLKLQGGPMTLAEVGEFESKPGYREAVRLRRWDDQAKIAALEVPPLEHYGTRIQAAAPQRAR
jgi:[1-hydroxy-2-(trimethylamino)ethyl]phosphonate dioxygenase